MSSDDESGEVGEDEEEDEKSSDDEEEELYHSACIDLIGKRRPIPIIGAPLRFVRATIVTSH